MIISCKAENDISNRAAIAPRGQLLITSIQFSQSVSQSVSQSAAPDEEDPGALTALSPHSIALNPLYTPFNTAPDDEQGPGAPEVLASPLAVLPGAVVPFMGTSCWLEVLDVLAAGST
jgi:hypothetical protein